MEWHFGLFEDSVLVLRHGGFPLLPANLSTKSPKLCLEITTFMPKNRRIPQFLTKDLGFIYPNCLSRMIYISLTSRTDLLQRDNHHESMENHGMYGMQKPLWPPSSGSSTKTSEYFEKSVLLYIRSCTVAATINSTSNIALSSHFCFFWKKWQHFEDLAEDLLLDM